MENELTNYEIGKYIGICSARGGHFCINAGTMKAFMTESECSAYAFKLWGNAYSDKEWSLRVSFCDGYLEEVQRLKEKTT